MSIEKPRKKWKTLKIVDVDVDAVEGVPVGRLGATFFGTAMGIFIANKLIYRFIYTSDAASEINGFFEHFLQLAAVIGVTGFYTSSLSFLSVLCFEFCERKFKKK